MLGSLISLVGFGMCFYSLKQVPKVYECMMGEPVTKWDKAMNYYIDAGLNYTYELFDVTAIKGGYRGTIIEHSIGVSHQYAELIDINILLKTRQTLECLTGYFIEFIPKSSSEITVKMMYVPDRIILPIKSINGGYK